MSSTTIPEKPFRGQDFTGKKFGRITVLGLDRIDRQTNRPTHRYAVWRCLCECGNVTTVSGGALTSGNTSSCGCLHKELLAAMSRTHGHKPLHGKVHPLYYRWYGMFQRCRQKNHYGYRWYGAEGVTVCERWKDFAKFLEDMESSFQPGLTLERVDGAKVYSPETVIWATWEVQRQSKKQRGPASQYAAYQQ